MQLPNNTVPSESNFLAPFFAGAGKSSAAADALTSAGAPAGKGKFDQLFDDLKGSPRQTGSPTPAELAGLGFVACPMPFVPVAPAEEPVLLTESGVAETEGSLEDGEASVAVEVLSSVGLPAGKTIGQTTRDSRISARSTRTVAESEKEGGLRRVLGPWSLTAIGIGAIIGSGIFVMTGRVAAQDAGPAVLISFLFAGFGCALAALCYAEFASMVPVAGSAYTYAYAALGELWYAGCRNGPRMGFFFHGHRVFHVRDKGVWGKTSGLGQHISSVSRHK